jgi:hypothetical protein
MFSWAGNASASSRPSRLAVGLPAVEILRRTARSAKDGLRCARNDDSGMRSQQRHQDDMARNEPGVSEECGPSAEGRPNSRLGVVLGADLDLCLEVSDFLLDVVDFLLLGPNLVALGLQLGLSIAIIQVVRILGNL